jgi:hypothetical protein
MSATIRIVPNLVELPRALLKSHARLRVGSPTNSVSVINLVPKWAAEQRGQRDRCNYYNVTQTQE